MGGAAGLGGAAGFGIGRVTSWVGRRESSNLRVGHRQAMCVCVRMYVCMYVCMYRPTCARAIARPSSLPDAIIAFTSASHSEYCASLARA